MKIVHALPGRLRLEINDIHQQPGLATFLEDKLTLERGISIARANPETGRLLVNFVPGLTSTATIKQKITEIITLPEEVIDNLCIPEEKKPRQPYELERLSIKSQMGLTMTTGLMLALTYLRHEDKSVNPRLRLENIMQGGTFLTLLTGIPIFRTAIDHLVKKKLSTELLAGIVSITSLFLDQNRFGLSTLGVVYLNTLIRTAVLESARDRIRVMLEGNKPIARVVSKQGKTIVPGNHLAKDALFEVHEGERLAADGVIEKGIGSVNQYPIRGNKKPRQVATGDTIYAGDILSNGTLLVRATKVGDETRVGQLIKRLKQKNASPDKYTVKQINKKSFLALAASTGYYAVTKNLKGALNMLVMGMPAAAGLEKVIPAEVAAVQAISVGALSKSGNDIANLGKANLILIEDGSFLADANSLNQKIIANLEYLGYKCMPLSIPIEHLDKGSTIAMVGAENGNVPSMSAVDVGITKALGDNLQLKAASIILTDNDPLVLVYVAKLSRESKKIAKQNTGISSVSTAGGYMLGCMNKLTPAWTGVIQNFTNLAILINSSRLLLPKTMESP